MECEISWIDYPDALVQSKMCGFQAKTIIDPYLLKTDDGTHIAIKSEPIVSQPLISYI